MFWYSWDCLSEQCYSSNYFWLGNSQGGGWFASRTLHIKYNFSLGVDGGPYTLIPDSALSGNTTGFTATIIDISELDEVSLSFNCGWGNIKHCRYKCDSITWWDWCFITEKALQLWPVQVWTFKVIRLIGTDASTQPIYKYANSDLRLMVLVKLFWLGHGVWYPYNYLVDLMI